ncbi:MAG: Zn-dependent hydrolase of the beta-lactamase fold-like protein [Candidatus Woesebacteria bacterium GW2011_GWB1_38_5b]|uniref:Zn-dependent hydrolase of the beta-lactamase fold-like protein n=1 Tax=Candidatus Woesebacteria bacterium GW2011_GWB1_38_5b TaxID=1618569 RepID=A0A0G0K854_9BACT|nr:MAG: Zn-dependent hydrolase of the beta-lactamase fold-like protein [Candidatus Woesebacteria bacterium GW2011_GWB1_38_5b]
MEITYFGHSSFKIKGKLTTVVTDPFDPEMVGLKFPKIEADILTISHAHQDHSKAELVNVTRKIIHGPGEYEIAGTSIIGFATYHDNQKGLERGKNTIFVIEMDNLRVCHLGDLGHELSENQVEDIGQIDVLMVPVGGEYTIGPEEAVKVVSDIEPKIIIPMHYQVEGLDPKSFSGLKPVNVFVTQMGLPSQTQAKLMLKDTDLSSDEQRIVILEKN